MSLPFDAWAREIAARTEHALTVHLPPEDATPARLHAAMRYACLGGGKRVRPLLAHAAAEAMGGSADADLTERAAVAVELIHAYSLVHDDMPEMDDDRLRRGRPTVHVAYDQATALLVGDALQALAFEVLALPATAHAAAMVRELARAAGSRGMAGGQAIDLASVGLALDRASLETMHRLKTGALLRAAVRLGAWSVAMPEPPVARALDGYAEAVGLAFQVADDVLDTEADTATLGKTAGKDAAAGKPTYVSLLGVDAARALALRLRDDALAALEALDAPGQRPERLAQVAEFVVARAH